jgi:uncharacterized damage-inducible protein DinB
MFLLLLFAQAFSSELPPGIPKAEGTVVDRAVLRSIDVIAGTGAEAKPHQEYEVHYTGWLRDGTKFDSSRDRNEPIKFVQGRRLVIPGWESGFEGMRAGGKRRLFIPYQMAYGESGRGSIPPKAELIFDVELISVRDAEPEQPGRDVLLVLREEERKLLALARAIPEESYTWRPKPEVRSVAEILAHVALGNRLLTDSVDGPPANLGERIERQAKTEKERRTKAALLEMVEESFADVRKAIEPLRTSQLARETRFWGETTTVRGVYVAIDAHVAEHLGQLIVYARMQGIEPPWSK